MEIYYVNGFFKRRNNAKVSVEDRGFNFSDGVYELISYLDEKLIFFEKHYSRLSNSLRSLKISSPLSNKKILKLIIKRLIKLNRIKSGYIYIQITRGTAKRNHVYSKEITPNLVIFCLPLRKIEKFKSGVKVRTSQDLRWGRCDVKSISLLPNILEKQIASNQGYYETWQIKDNYITEGTTSNAFIVDKNGSIRTYPKTTHILGGVTRDVIIQIAKKQNIKIIEKPFTLDDIKYCKEAFLTSTTVKILPVIKVNNININAMKIGEITKILTSKINKKING
jgi:D-alanine transaminase